jgi:hypothetical protein
MIEKAIVVEWDTNERQTPASIVEVKPSNKRFWKIFNYVFVFTSGFFLGMLIILLIYF